MTSPESGLGRPEQPNFLSVDHASQLIFLSFKFSQGSGLLQNNIFRWLRLEYPLYKIKNSDLANIKEEVGRKAGAFILTEKDSHTKIGEDRAPINKEGIRQVTSAQVESLTEILDGSSDLIIPDKKYILHNLADSLIKRDTKFEHVAKRPSQLVAYGFEAKSTGLAEYNTMFRQIKEFIEKELGEQKKGMLTMLSEYDLREVERMLAETKAE